MKNLKSPTRPQEILRRLEAAESGSVPILSLYMNLDPEAGPGRAISVRLRDVLRPVQSLVTSDELDRAAAASIRAGIERVLEIGETMDTQPGHTMALFLCDRAELEELVILPGRIWDLAIASPRPHLRPLRALLDEFRTVATVVLDARRAEIITSYTGEVIDRQVIKAEVVRKKNLSGWHGLDEHRIRQHAEEVRNHLFREVAEALTRMHRDSAMEVVFVGGQDRITEALLGFLSPEVRALVADTFPIDLHTVTEGKLMQTVLQLEGLHERREEESMVAAVYATAAAGDRATIGIDRVLRAANRRSIELLLIQHEAGPEGWLCPSCDSLALSGPTCPICGAEARQVHDLFEALVRSVVESGGAVEDVVAQTPLDKDLVAATLRSAG